MSPRHYRMAEATPTTKFSWSLLAVYIGLPLAGYLLLYSVS
jgi:hypothetical protein